MGLTSAWTTFRPHPGQRALWTCPRRFVAVPAGRGSGKTELAKRRLVRYLPVRKPWGDPRYFYGAPTREQAKRVAWDHLKALTPREWLARDPSDSELRMRTVFGSELWVVGLDKPERIEGVQWDGGVIDESSDVWPGTFDLNVSPALVHRSGWCWRIGVPKRAGVGAQEYRQFYEEARAGRLVDAAGFTWPSSDIVPAEKLAYARKNMDAKDYNEQFNASWETAGGAIFYAWDRAYNMRPCPYRPGEPIVVGSDFNVDPMAWVLCHAWEDRLEVFDELWVRDTNTPAVLGQLHAKYGSHRAWFKFFGDAAGKARKTSASQSDYQIIATDERFRALGRTVHYPEANPLVKDRFAATNTMLRSAADERRLFVDPGCRALVLDLESRYYKPGSCEPADSGDLGHSTDALGYIVWALYPMRMPIDYVEQEVTVRG